MIIGVGIDQLEVARMARKLQNADLKHKLFSRTEQAYCDKQGHPAQHYAARFCAKEAFLKALGTGWRGDFEFYEIEIHPDPSGRPTIELSGGVQRYAEGIGATRIHVSMSHLSEIASAIVILEN